ncbi:hypothetical protein ACQVP2_13260 [Methylobacterium aquaticum]|uniref:Uncharacterized protein n=1 Tax=Methylobacterium aquaticum TaxID=270351 RepID=A0A0J6SNF3_9HYPH|nr:hypothetical protein [Methylobacterium aquaticum]KMO36750.1 hypothetical protein VP06_09290 [Methylobacterium aquaticum]
MTLAERLEANAILDRLVADEPTFSVGDARRLVALLPMRKPRRFTVLVGLGLPGTKTRGQAAGHGEVEMEEPGETKTWSSDPTPVLKIGGYAITHVPGSITIALMWSQTKLDQSGQSCGLLYDTATGEPREMVIARQVAWQVLIFMFATTRYVPWKTPRQDGSAG